MQDWTWFLVRFLVRFLGDFRTSDLRTDTDAVFTVVTVQQCFLRALFTNSCGFSLVFHVLTTQNSTFKYYWVLNNSNFTPTLKFLPTSPVEGSKRHTVIVESAMFFFSMRQPACVYCRIRSFLVTLFLIPSTQVSNLLANLSIILEDPTIEQDYRC